LKKNKKLGLVLSSGLVLATLIVAMGIQPASATDAVILPDGANGIGADTDLLAYACPSIGSNRGFVEVLAPAPVKSDGWSFVDPLQPGRFKWTLSVGGASDSTGGSFHADSEVLTVFLEELDQGDDLELTLTGNIQDHPIPYQPEDLTISLTVVDPTFSNGSGTIADPWIIASASDLQKTRCHTEKHFALANSISLTGKWLPIGTQENKWKGSLDGRGYSIFGLNANHPTLSRLGLFGSVEHCYFRNLTIVSPRVHGSQNVGALAGKARHCGVENVSVTDAEVSGNKRIGLLMGEHEDGGLVSETSVEGTILAKPLVWQWNGSDSTAGSDPLNAVGGMTGYDDGQGTSHLNNSVEVEIIAEPETNYRYLAQQASVSLQFRFRQANIGGYVGFSTTQSIFKFLNISSNIKVASFWDVERIGGVAGQGRSPWSNLDVDSNLHIVSLGERDLREIGGAFGYTGNDSLSFSRVSTDILVESANDSNTNLEIVEDGSESTVSLVGGVYGALNNSTQDGFVEADLNVVVRNVKSINKVAGYAARYGHFNGIGYSDIFVSGAIDLNASEAISQVGGYANLESDGKVSGSRSFAAVSISTSGPAVVEEATVNPFIGSLNEPEDSMGFSFYWDSNLNGSSNPTGFPGQAASTSQLKSRSFLEETGMDFSSIWNLRRGSYPELKPGLFSWGSFGSTSGGSSSSGSPIAVQPAGPQNVVIPKKAKAGTRVVVSGERLNRVTDVFVAGKRVNYWVKTNGTLTFKVPMLEPKKYQVRIVSETADTETTRKIRITNR